MKNSKQKSIKRKGKTCKNGSGNMRPNSLKSLLYFARIYFNQRGRTEEEAQAFFDFYVVNKWHISAGKLIANWKAAANNWIWDCRLNEQLSDKSSSWSIVRSRQQLIKRIFFEFQ
jgi:hypothetical protein